MERLPTLSHLFSSNEPPGASELALIDNAVRVMNETIANLTLRLEKVKDERQQCGALLSPIRRMPGDVLGEVFGYAVDASNARSYGCGINQAVAFCLVCKGWRDAAYATHRLWASFGFTLPLDWQGWDRVERWMSLSGALPKNISVYAGADYCNPSQAMWGQGSCGRLSNPRLARLLTEGPDIRTLSITCANSQCLHYFCQAIQSATPEGTSTSRPWDRIEVLSIRVSKVWTERPSPDYVIQDPDEMSGGGARISSTSFLQHLPPVKSFHLDTPFQQLCSPYIPTPLSIPIPHAILSNLTTLSLTNDWDGCAVVLILRLCHGSDNLQELVFGCKSRSVDHLDVENELERDWALEIWRNPDKMFLFPNLRILRFCRLHPDAFKITRFFKAPSLAELELNFDEVEDQDIPSEDNAAIYNAGSYELLADLPRFIERSACNRTLRRLAFRGGLRLEIDDLKRWLKKTILPALSHLAFDGIYLPQELFDCLRYRDRSHALPLTYVRTIELLNLPTEVHALGLYLWEARRRMQPGDRAYPFPDTDITVTIKERDG